MGRASTTATDTLGDIADPLSGPGSSPDETWCDWRVLLPVPLAGGFDYLGPPGLAAGTIVAVPLGARVLPGVVWARGDGHVAREKLKPIQGVFDAPALPEISRRFVDWIADYTLSPPGAVLKLVLSCPPALVPEEPEPVLAMAAGAVALFAPKGPVRPTAARMRVVGQAQAAPPLPALELARLAGCGVSVVRGLAEAGVLQTLWRSKAGPVPHYQPDHATVDLTADQARAAEALRGLVHAGTYRVALLDGVTGSGKTEVYFEAMAEALKAGRQVLMLLPEIALTAQWLDRFAARFGARPTQWHSRMTGLARRRAWRAVADGSARVVVGARSALMLPYPDLGLIVVDEEHEPAFKQEDGVHYHARDMAVVRGFLGEHPVVLASATPSLETMVNADRGRYRHLVLPKRIGGARLPTISAIDLRDTPPDRGQFLAHALVAEAAETIARGEQVLLFLNRRGYAPLTLCRQCGHRFDCPDCDAWLVEHRLARRLVCHHCGYSQRTPNVCPSCGGVDTLTPIGPGVERIAEEVAERLPTARVLLLTSDHLRGPGDLEAKMHQIRDGAVDLVIGTQLIAKGHHFPKLTLVGVVDADLGLGGGDLRAGERTFQLLTQVAGRAGRADRPGFVRLQTYDPDQPVLAALLAGDRDGFLAVEADERAARRLPPFGRLATVLISAPTAVLATDVANAMARVIPTCDGVRVLGPADPPLAVIQRRHRRRFLVMADRNVRLQPILRAWRDAVRVPSSVRVTVDVDPYSFL